MNVLVDTSVWSLALRRTPGHLSFFEKAAVAELTELIREGRVRIIGIVRQELLSGIKDPAQFEKLREILRAFPDEPTQTSDYETASLASNKCRGKGIAVSASDMLIYAVAQLRGWAIFSTDADFKRFSAVLGARLHSIR
ncbi:MAG: PIN domain-containing protein [Acidobacteria bacterium]|nr:PIN domain-containing protein [Acidobacteriota bacterium]MBS1865380.1 PIN domain-containing protein [Acidobacteriota bacterium]